MSELYDRVVKLLQGAADQKLTRGASSRSQYIVLNPDTFAAIREELGTPAEAPHALQTPGTWLLGVNVLLEEGQHPMIVKLRTEEYY